LDQRLRSKYEAARSDFGQYQREKKKKEKDAKKKKQKTKGMIDKKQTTLVDVCSPTTEDGLTQFFTDEKDAEKILPPLISNYPSGASFFDYYFDIDTCGWT
jgi:hypothetical protein